MVKVNLRNGTLDLGIVTNNIDKMLTFYSETLGFEKVGEVPFQV